MADQDMQDILTELKLEELIEIFQENKITKEILPSLNLQLIAELIKPIGARVAFIEYCCTYFNKKSDDEEPEMKRKRTSEIINITEITSQIEEKDLSKCKDIVYIESLDCFLTNKNGQEILHIYQQRGQLNEILRKSLTKEILCKLENNDLVLNNAGADHLAELIVSKFPSETKKTWYVPAIKKKNSSKGKSEPAAGKLLTTHRNRRVAFVQLQKINDKKSEKNGPNIQAPEITKEINDSINWLHENQEPWSIVLIKWKETYEIRQQELSLMKNLTTDIASSNWKLYKHPEGYKLIEQDFSMKFEDVKITQTKFELFMSIILENTQVNAKDKTAVELKKHISTSEENPDFFVIDSLKLLCHLYPPKNVVKSSKYKGQKASKADAKDSMMKHVSNTAGVSKIREERKANANLNNNSPYIIVSGETNTIEEIFVCLDEILYKVPNALTALEICFKAYHVFSLNYPFQSLTIWMLLQKGLFNITTKQDKIISHIESILSTLKTSQNDENKSSEH